LRDRCGPIVCPRELSVDGAGGVGVIAQVHREETAFFEGPAPGERPERRLQGIDDVPAAPDLRRFPLEVGAGGDAVDLAGERVVLPVPNEGGVPRREEFLLRGTGEGPEDQPPEVPAGVDGEGVGVGGAGTLAEGLDAPGRVGGVEEGHRRKAHQGAVPCGALVGQPRIGLAGEDEALEGLSGRRPDIKAASVRAQVAFPEPAHVALQLVDGVEPPLLDEALGEAEGEGGVVGPLAGLEVERPAADHAGYRRERPGRSELKRRAEGVACCEAEEAAAITVEGVHGGRWASGGKGVVIRGGTSRSRTRRVSSSLERSSGGRSPVEGRNRRLRRLQDLDDPIDDRCDGRVTEMAGPVENQVGTGGKESVWPDTAGFAERPLRKIRVGDTDGVAIPDLLARDLTENNIVPTGSRNDKSRPPLHR